MSSPDSQLLDAYNKKDYWKCVILILTKIVTLKHIDYDTFNNAFLEGQREVCGFFFEWEINPNKKITLSEAPPLENLEVCRFLINKKFDINEKDLNGNNIWLMYAFSKYFDIFPYKFVLKMKVNINNKNKYGHCVLHFMEYTNKIKLIIQDGGLFINPSRHPKFIFSDHCDINKRRNTKSSKICSGLYPLLRIILFYL